MSANIIKLPVRYNQLVIPEFLLDLNEFEHNQIVIRRDDLIINEEKCDLVVGQKSKSCVFDCEYSISVIQMPCSTRNPDQYTDVAFNLATKRFNETGERLFLMKSLPDETSYFVVIEFPSNEPDYHAYGGLTTYDAYYQHGDPEIRKVCADIRAKFIRYGYLASGGVKKSAWVSIPGRAFEMGSPQSKKRPVNNERQHRVNIEPFKMLKTPVTFAMYDLYCLANNLEMVEDKGFGRGWRPVIGVSYWDAVNYCEWLNEQTGWNTRLPTEAEWEYACRAGTTTPFWTGHNITDDQANFGAITCGSTTPVDRFPPNPWGLYDMHGNVWEWCSSEYDPDYSGKELEDASKDISNENSRVLRGGSWFSRKADIRSAKRAAAQPFSIEAFPGFRIVISA